MHLKCFICIFRQILLFMDDLQFLFILLKLVIIFFVHQQKRRAAATLDRAQSAKRPRIHTGGRRPKMQSNCSCPFRGKLDKERYLICFSFYQINGYIHFNDTLCPHHNSQNITYYIKLECVKLTKYSK